MGLFDAYDPATYQGAQGGLLDQLLASVAATPTPSAGFPGSPAPTATPPVVAADDDDTPATPAQASPIAVGGYQMPRIGPAAAFTPPAGTLDPNTGEHVVAPMQQPAPGVLQHIGAALNSVGAPNSLFHNLVTNPINALITGQTQAQTVQAQQQALQQKQVAQLSAALTGAGIPQQQALQLATIHAIDKEAGKALIEKALGPPQAAPQYAWDPKSGKAVHLYEPEQKDNFQVVQTGENGIGGKSFSKMNKATGEMTPIAGAPGADTGGGIGDMSLTGPAYLATVPKAQAGIMRGMVDGTIQPPSSFAASKPYWQSMLAGAKNLDPNFDENTWTARHKMSGDLASSGNSSMGGILSNGGSSFSHLAELSGSMSGLGNSSHDYPGGGAAAYVQNYVGNALGGSDTKAKIKAINDNLGHYGQESTKFYSGTGGGAEERMNALKEMNPTTTSSEEMASYVEKEKSLMLDRLNNKFQQIRDTYGNDNGNAIIAKKLPDIQRNIATIDANISRLRGQGGTTPAALPAGWSVKVN